MKLKNLIKKPPRQNPKENKTFRTSIKSKKKHTRIDQREKNKSSKSIKILAVVILGVFAAVVILFLMASLYNSIILKSLNSKKIISPGVQNIITIDEARRILIEKDIRIKTLEYSSGSAALSLTIENGPVVYFSSGVLFEEQADILYRLLSSLKMEGRSARIIDLRYNRPIVKF